MKQFLFLCAIFFLGPTLVSAQQNRDKERAEQMAKEDFSKTKYKKKEKYGVVKEMNKVVVSTPVIKSNVSDYNGNYVSNDLAYKIEIRTDTEGIPIATLTIADNPNVVLKNFFIKDAFFKAVKNNADGTEELWEGVFINKDDNGVSEFGLGIKLSNPIKLTEGLKIEKVFFKKVSP